MCPSSPSRRAVGRSGSLPALVVHAPLASPPPFDRSCPRRPGPASFPLARPALPLPSRFLSPSSAPSSRYTLLRSEEHTSELQSRQYLVCRLLLEKKQL